MELYNVRIFYSKKGDARYISHLDLSRFMQRSLKRTELPLWHTEGFNPHPYVTFALPLSVGQSGENETMDFRLTRQVAFEEIRQRLAAVMPPDIEIKKAAAPVYKAKDIQKAIYEIELFECADLYEKVEQFFAQKKIITAKKTKKGVMKEIDIAPMILAHEIEAQGKDILARLTLLTGSEVNLNPALAIKALEAFCKREFCPVRITRKEILTKDGVSFE